MSKEKKKDVVEEKEENKERDIVGVLNRFNNRDSSVTISCPKTGFGPVTGRISKITYITSDLPMLVTFGDDGEEIGYYLKVHQCKLFGDKIICDLTTGWKFEFN